VIALPNSSQAAVRTGSLSTVPLVVKPLGLERDLALAVADILG
jgi:hypothetical protein